MKASSDLVAALARHAPGDGAFPTPFDGVELFRVSSPLDRLPGVYTPSVCVIVQGEKQTYFDGKVHRYDSSNYLCATVPLPIEAEIRDASPEHPVLGLLISLESRTMAELMVRFRTAASAMSASDDRDGRGAPDDGLVVAEWDERFTTALDGLVELLDDDVPRDLLGHGRLQELLYAVITGPAGPTIVRTLGGPAQQLGGVLTYIRSHLDKPLSVDQLASRAGMSRAVFDRHFKATTSLSPLQYVKALRLNDAAMRIANGTDITRAAADVGYVSPSQFSREFKRHFGSSPRTWARNTTGALDPQAVIIKA